MNKEWAKKQTGFTIVELLIVIVVIGILAAITIVAYNGVQARANQSKINADMRSMKQAIEIARNQNSVALRYVTLNTATGSGCWSKASDTDLATLDKATDSCWTTYVTTLSRISTASNMNINNLVDPWGRPYYIDENEGEGADPPNACGDDYIGVYARPFTTGQTMTKHTTIHNIQPACL